ncbi:hypothetical protein [Vibrio phage vB_VhaP_PG11]|nr:hypothetical protein [Vibrio phage vB_VhaP_PG11]
MSRFQKALERIAFAEHSEAAYFFCNDQTTHRSSKAEGTLPCGHPGGWCAMECPLNHLRDIQKLGELMRCLD